MRARPDGKTVQIEQEVRTVTSRTVTAVAAGLLALAGLATALGVTVLLQQYSVLYPTGPIALGMLALGAVVGIGLPLVLHAVGAHSAQAGAAPPVAHA